MHLFLSLSHVLSKWRSYFEDEDALMENRKSSHSNTIKFHNTPYRPYHSKSVVIHDGKCAIKCKE